eukprot:GILK01002305.1.p2 GENE.GILK01002305.1~~GILK01002305.1.p2  ORF type:complete len:444 (+),score=93.23 GILK01002305.1:92-1423(+)
MAVDRVKITIDGDDFREEEYHEGRRLSSSKRTREADPSDTRSESSTRRPWTRMELEKLATAVATYRDDWESITRFVGTRSETAVIAKAHEIHGKILRGKKSHASAGGASNSSESDSDKSDTKPPAKKRLRSLKADKTEKSPGHPNKWTTEEDFKYIEAVTKHGRDWDAIQAYFPDRSRKAITHRFRQLQSRGLVHVEEQEAAEEPEQQEQQQEHEDETEQSDTADSKIKSAVGTNASAICSPMVDRHGQTSSKKEKGSLKELSSATSMVLPVSAGAASEIEEGKAWRDHLPSDTTSVNSNANTLEGRSTIFKRNLQDFTEAMVQFLRDNSSNVTQERNLLELKERELIERELRLAALHEKEQTIMEKETLLLEKQQKLAQEVLSIRSELKQQHSEIEQLRAQLDAKLLAVEQRERTLEIKMAELDKREAVLASKKESPHKRSR